MLPKSTKVVRSKEVGLEPEALLTLPVTPRRPLLLDSGYLSSGSNEVARKIESL